MDRKKILDTLAEESQIMDLFDKLPEHCLVCTAPYDKKDLRMVTTWNVVVRSNEQKVNLYCPTCWDTAMRVIKDFKEQNNGKDKS